MNAIELLEKQHREVEKLFSRIEAASDSEEKQQLFEKIADNLAAHATIEEQLFYPECRKFDRELIDEAIEEHLEVKKLIAELLDLDADDAEFDEKIAALKESVQHHVEEEEGELFPKVDKKMAEDRLETLGDEMESMFEGLREEEPRYNVPGEIGTSPRA